MQISTFPAEGADAGKTRGYAWPPGALVTVTESEAVVPDICNDCKFVRIGFKVIDVPEMERLEPAARVCGDDQEYEPVLVQVRTLPAEGAMEGKTRGYDCPPGALERVIAPVDVEEESPICSDCKFVTSGVDHENEPASV